MRTLLIAAVAASLNLAVAGVCAADQSTGMMNGVAHGTGMDKARCSPGDPNVLVDKKTKMYMLDKSAKAPMKGAMGSVAPPSMTGMSSGTSTKVSMCKSEADSMGAHMGGAMKGKSGS